MATPLVLTSWPTPNSLSPACQEIIHEDFSDRRTARVTVRSTLANAELWPVVALHKCNGVTLTPSGLYADMAATVAQYIWKRDRGLDAEIPGIHVIGLEVDKTLIVKDPQEGSGQWIEMDGVLETPESGMGDIIGSTLRCKIRSVTAEGVRLAELAHCAVQYEWSLGWLSEWSHYTPLVKSKIDGLRVRAQTLGSEGAVQLVHREKAYRLFKSFVDYGEKYQNMAEVVFDTETLEATAKLDFHTHLAGDLVGPYFLDGSCHLSGFVCNAVEQEREKNAYISHGIEGVRIAPTFDPKAKGADIRNYVRMQPLPGDKTVLVGDVFVLQNEEIVGVWAGVKFKRIPRRVLNVFLPPPKK